MLLLALALVVAQVPSVPQVLVPGAVYDAALVEPIAGHEAVELCDEHASATTIELDGGPLDSTRPIHRSGCESPILLVGTSPRPGEPIASAALALDRETGETEVHLSESTYRLRWTPYSDGGTRLVLLDPDGFPHLLFESAAPAASAEIVWAGDLNGDGRLDLVLEATEGFTTYQQLLISDANSSPQVVAETVTEHRS